MKTFYSSILLFTIVFTACNEKKTVGGNTSFSDVNYSNKVNTVSNKENTCVFFVNAEDVFLYDNTHENKKVKVKLKLGDSLFAYENYDTSRFIKVWGNQLDTGFIEYEYLSRIKTQSIQKPNTYYLVQKKILNASNLALAYLLEIRNNRLFKAYYIDTIDRFQYDMVVSKKISWKDGSSKEVIVYSLISEACGVPYMDKIFIRLNEQVSPFFKNEGVSDAGVFYKSKDIYYPFKSQYFPICSDEEPQPLDSLPKVIRDYADSPSYFMVYEYEMEALYDEKNNEEKLDVNGEPILNKIISQYSIYMWDEKNRFKQIFKYDELINK